jgi:hypothetical protein
MWGFLVGVCDGNYKIENSIINLIFHFLSVTDFANGEYGLMAIGGSLKLLWDLNLFGFGFALLF